MIGHRRAAAALHGLQEEDRRWLLGEISEADRDVLNRLLGELAELGFEPGCTAIPDVTSPAQLDGRDARDLSSADTVRRATAHDMVVLLEHEPSSLIAQVLSIEDWPWKQAFLQMLPSLRRDRIASMSSYASTNGTARIARLLEELARRLHVPAASATAVTTSYMRMLPFRQAFTAFLHKVKRWGR